MAYFSNGTEGLDYQERYCFRCVHYNEEGCPVWVAHLGFNRDQLNKDGEGEGPVFQILSMLIPERPDGFADQCRMFVETKE